MAITTNLISNTFKDDQRFLAHSATPLKFAVIDIAITTPDTYATGGITFSTTDVGIDTLLGGTVTVNAGLVGEVLASTKKLKIYGQEPTSASAGVIALSEIANASTLIQGKTFRLFVWGH